MTSEEYPGDSADGEPKEPDEPGDPTEDAAKKPDENPADAGGDAVEKPDEGEPLDLSDVDLSGLESNIKVPVPRVKVPLPKVDPAAFGALDGIRDMMKKLGDMGNIRVPAILNSIPEHMRVEPMKMPDFPIDDSRWRTADAAEETAEAAKATAAYTSELLAAMRESVVLNGQAVKLSEATRQDNVRAQTFTKRMSVASLVLSIAGVLFAGVSLLVAAQPSPAPIVNIPPDPAPTVNITVVPTPQPTTPAP